MMVRAGAMVTLALLSVLPTAAFPLNAELGGSMASMRRQYAVARQNDYTFLRTPAQVREFVREDRLHRLESNEHLVVNRVSFPYARPAVKLFVERLATQYFQATGERLVVTSLTRPLSRQPRNAHALSVHPAGMAVDLRIPRNAASRRWLESVLLQLEARGVLDATRERRPPHYHIAVFPDRYTAYAERMVGREASVAAGIAVTETEPDVNANAPKASLEPTAATDSAHAEDHAVADEPVVSAAGPDAAVPLAATLGVAGVAIAGMIRRRVRHRREERRARARTEISS